MRNQNGSIFDVFHQGNVSEQRTKKIIFSPDFFVVLGHFDHVDLLVLGIGTDRFRDDHQGIDFLYSRVKMLDVFVGNEKRRFEKVGIFKEKE